MTTIQLAMKVVEERQAHLFRYRQGQMQARPHGSGSKRGWTLLDLFTASAIVAVADAVNEKNRAKLDSLPPHRAGLICLELIRERV
jgi:hypothetical protein